MNLPGGDPAPRGTPDAADADSDAAMDLAAAARRAVSRKELDEVFGDVLPSVTRDELDDGSDRSSGSNDRDQWYRDNRPPHHE